MWFLVASACSWFGSSDGTPPPGSDGADGAVAALPVRGPAPGGAIPALPPLSEPELQAVLEPLAEKVRLRVPVAKAKALGTAEAVFTFVRDEIGTEAYRGSLRGAAGTLENGRGNDVDKGLLLVAMAKEVGAKAVLCQATADPLVTWRPIAPPDPALAAAGEEIDAWSAALRAATPGFVPWTADASAAPAPRWRVRLEVGGIERVLDPTSKDAMFSGGQVLECPIVTLPDAEIHRVQVRHRCGATEIDAVEKPTWDLYHATIALHHDCGADPLSVEVTVRSPGVPDAVARHDLPVGARDAIVAVSTGPHDGRLLLEAEAASNGDGGGTPGLFAFATVEQAATAGEIFGRPVVVDGPNVAILAASVDDARYGNAVVGDYVFDRAIVRMGPTSAPEERRRVQELAVYLGFVRMADANARASVYEAAGHLGIDGMSASTAFGVARANGRTWLPVDASEVDRAFARTDARAEISAAIAGGSWVVAPEGGPDPFGRDVALVVSPRGDVAARAFSAPRAHADAAALAACPAYILGVYDQAARSALCSADPSPACSALLVRAERALTELADECDATTGG